MLFKYLDHSFEKHRAPREASHGTAIGAFHKAIVISCSYMGVSIVMRVPPVRWMVYKWKTENPMKMDDNWGYPYDETETSV